MKLNKLKFFIFFFPGAMICVECGRPVNDVYKQFGGKGNIRLTRCVGILCLFLVSLLIFDLGLLS